MPDSTEAQMLREVIKIKDELIEIKDEFLAALQNGMESVRGSIIALSTEHKSALLEQERRNATFAERQRVDDIADIVSKRGNEIDLLCREQRQLRAELTKLSEETETMEDRVLNDPDDRHWVTAARKRQGQHEETILYVIRDAGGYLIAAAFGLILAALGLAHFAPNIFGWH